VTHAQTRAPVATAPRQHRRPRHRQDL